jgi:hypothetical protein
MSLQPCAVRAAEAFDGDFFPQSTQVSIGMVTEICSIGWRRLRAIHKMRLAQSCAGAKTRSVGCGRCSSGNVRYGSAARGFAIDLLRS